MKTKRFSQFASIVIGATMMIFASGCEGPQGPIGPPGADGADANNSCLNCHADGIIQDIKEEFHQSAHSAGLNAVAYAGGRASCARCHSSEGFIEFAENGVVEENIAAPSAWECQTCHTIHQTFEEVDYASILRLPDPINFLFDETVTADFAAGNTCANCHQSRRAEPNISDPGTEFEIRSTHYGPHHGPQSNVLYGVGFAEISGSLSYPANGASTHFGTVSCTGCHMAEYGNGQGGHTFNPAIDACTQCHSGVTTFDVNGVQSEIALLLEELRDLLVEKGVVEQAVEDVYELNEETGEIELVTYVGEYHPIVGTHTMVEAQAFFNWIGLEEDRSLGVHNPDYVKALLTNSIEALHNQ